MELGRRLLLGLDLGPALVLLRLCLAATLNFNSRCDESIIYIVEAPLLTCSFAGLELGI